MTRMAANTPSYDQGASDQPLLGETIGENFNRIAMAHADREALVDWFTGRRWTYARLHHDVLALAHGLIRLGIDKGDRVGIWAPNCPEWTVLQYATAEIGAILVPINPAYRTDELAYVVNQAGIRLLVAAPSFRTSDYATMIEDARPGCPDLRWVVLLGSADWRALPDSGGDPRALAARQALLSPDDPINIQYTSGTTGHPNPAATLAAVEEERCTSLCGVPAMFIAELAQPGFDAYDLSSLRTGAMGGAPCPVEVMKQVVDRMSMTQVTIVYGMTETSPVSAQTRVDDTLDRRVSTVGRVHPHVEIKIVDPETGVTVPRGVPGELCTRGYSVMLGYWRQPGKTTEAIDAARWMHTGDLATMDADGYVAITGRLKDMVIRGGENVSPREIEEFLHTHQDVQDVQVIGVPDARLGEEIMAWIRLRPGAPAMTAADVREFADGKLARYKIPRYVRIVEDFPMTASGKVRKVEMREAAVSMLGLTDIAASQYS
jgi:fatty-acyl-CoA synthase